MTKERIKRNYVQERLEIFVGKGKQGDADCEVTIIAQTEEIAWQYFVQMYPSLCDMVLTKKEVEIAE